MEKDDDKSGSEQANTRKRPRVQLPDNPTEGNARDPPEAPQRARDSAAANETLDSEEDDDDYVEEQSGSSSHETSDSDSSEDNEELLDQEEEEEEDHAGVHLDIRNEAEDESSREAIPNANHMFEFSESEDEDAPVGTTHNNIFGGKFSNPRDANLVALAALEEIWRHYQQHSHPHLVLDDRVDWNNEVTCQFFLHQLERLPQPPTQLTIVLYDWDSSGSEEEPTDELPRRSIANVMKYNQQHWESVRFHCPFRFDSFSILQDLLNILAQCSRLDKLELSGMRPLGKEVGTWVRAVLESPDCLLSALHLTHCIMDLEFLREVMHGVQAYSKISYLQIPDCAIHHGNSTINLRALQELVNTGLSGKAGTNLKSLNLSRRSRFERHSESTYSFPTGKWLDSSCLPLLTQLLQQVPNLERLTLSHQEDLFSWEESDDESVEEHDNHYKAVESFSKALGYHHKLQVVDISACGMDRMGAVSLFQNLQHNVATSLLVLNLRFNNFAGETIVDYLPFFKSLRKLYLPARVGAREPFCQALRRNTMLLDCRCCRGDGRHKSFVSVFRRNRMIHRAKAMLNVPMGAWPMAFELLPERNDGTALFVALQVSHPGLTGGDRERVQRASTQRVSSTVEVPDDGWESEKGD